MKMIENPSVLGLAPIGNGRGSVRGMDPPGEKPQTQGTVESSGIQATERKEPMNRNKCSVIVAVLFTLLVCSPVETVNAGANPNKSRAVYLTGGTQPVETS